MHLSKFHFPAAVIALWICPIFRPAAAGEDVKPPPEAKFHLYLLIGQSNMAGRGRITDADRCRVPRVLMLTKENQWVPAAHPLHFDKPTIAAVGLGIDFAKVMARQDPSITIGLVPCAVGGTPLSRWSTGGDLYRSAIERAKAAAQKGTLKGVLWHQGESDSREPDTADTYARRLDKMIGDLRADLKTPDLPFVAGRLGEFFTQHKEFPYARKVDAALADLPRRVEHTACAGAEGLVDKGDGVHFSADACREFGKRYAAEMLRLSRQKPNRE